MAKSANIAEIQKNVVGMYSEHTWPTDRRTEEEMGWRFKCLGLEPDSYEGKKVLDMGCGTGEYAMWYAMNGAEHVTGIDLSDGSLAIARQRKDDTNSDNIDFTKMDILNATLPDNHFDYSYSVGVLHHTGDAFKGFENLVRATKPGGVVIVSLYNTFSCSAWIAKQHICKWLGGDDIDKRVEWGKRLFPRTLSKMDKRYHGLNTDQCAYDLFGFPHSTDHTAGEVLKWFDKTGVEYKGSFAPLRIRDYFYAFSQPEYEAFRATFDGYPTTRFISDIMFKMSKRMSPSAERIHQFPRPNFLSRALVQLMWIPLGIRFNTFTISGTKKG